MAGPAQIRRVRVTLHGAVQGVGFRPFVYRLASELGLCGSVLNSAAGLVVDVEGERVETFLTRLNEERPSAAVVLSEERTWLAPSGAPSFVIEHSDGNAPRTAAILPDLATCPECLAETLDATERRYAYPFTNCTHCGPRYSILLDIPYDRPNTTMRGFPLCADCAREYGNPMDRRFHAQPVACPVCGPRLDAGIEEAVACLASGGIVALKGIGGFQLLVDASNEGAVARLRERKARDAKPFALMMPDLDAVRRFCHVRAEERVALASSAAPIVLLKPTGDAGLAPNVSDASPWLGVMLPYSPLHHLLMRAWAGPVVCTSGNLSGEPIETGDGASLPADVFLRHDRPIARSVDDSVVRVARGRECVLRRARGYAPLPVRVPQALPRVLAVGAHLKSTVAIALGRDVVVSQHIGDLDTLEAREAFARAIDDLCRLYRFTPELVACDLHPDYASTRWARACGLPAVEVQHHEAHVLACAAENDVRGPYLAVAWDGTGYGRDATVWGGEFFAVDGARIDRVAHLRPFRLPGGEAAVREGWRCADAMLFELGAAPSNPVVRRMLERGINAPLTSSVGRLFDAVASLAGVARESRFEGQAAMLLERVADGRLGKPYPMPGGDWSSLIDAIRRDPTDAAARFHASLVEWIAEVARPWDQIVLSGGVFQNALLTDATVERLEGDGKRVFTHQRIPPNDGGISLGQAVYSYRSA